MAQTRWTNARRGVRKHLWFIKKNPALVCRIRNEKCQNGGRIRLPHQFRYCYVFCSKGMWKMPTREQWISTQNVITNEKKVRPKKKKPKIKYVLRKTILYAHLKSVGSWMLGNFSNWLAWRPCMLTCLRENSEQCLSMRWGNVLSMRAGWRMNRASDCFKGWAERTGEKFEYYARCDSIYVKNVKHSYARDIPSTGDMGNPSGNFVIEPSQLTIFVTSNWQHNQISSTLFIFGAFRN